MARPCKQRWICSKPKCKRFFPADACTGGRCRMAEIRRIEKDASTKAQLADMLVNARPLCIEGGDVAIIIPKGENIMM